MPIAENFTPYATDEVLSFSQDGRERLTIVVKASFSFDGGRVASMTEPEPICRLPKWEGAPHETGLLSETDLVPEKPRVDVLLEGALTSPRPVPALDATLIVGSEIRKTVRVFGDRRWTPGVVRTLTPAAAQPWTSMPITWSKSFGHQFSWKEMMDAAGKSLPNFEDPAASITAWDDRPEPVGFGPIPSHWPQRVALAGTFDTAWEGERRPLLPRDFNPSFYNAAPRDQQLSKYIPGTQVVLGNMTQTPREVFSLPPLSVGINATDRRGTIFQHAAVPDTVIISPDKRTLSVVARVSFVPWPDLTAARVLIGPLTRGQRRALETGRQYLAFGARC